MENKKAGIDPKSLRIGNKIIEPKFPGVISEIEQLHTNYAVTSYNDSIPYNILEPVELSPDILEKAGFLRYSDMEYTLPIGEAEFHTFFDHTNPLKINFVKYYPDGVHKDGYWMPVNIEHLHTLQNAVQLLTSTDLKINM